MSTRPAAGARLRPSLARPERPVLIVVAGAAAVALVAIWLGVRLRVVVLDEAVYKFAAAQYADNFPRELVEDDISRGVARFFSFLLTPFVWAFDGDVAVRAGRVLNAIVWAGTAVPVYLLGRRVASRDGAAAAAVLSVAVPWLTLATILFSEALAYFLFSAVLLFMVRAIERPRPSADLVVAGLLLALVLTRVQFVVLVPAWLAVVAWAEWPHRREVRAIARRRPVIAGGVAIAVLASLAVVAAGAVDRVLTSLGGPYEGLRDRDTLQGDFGLAALFEVEMLALGVGVVPAILAAAWARPALAGRLGTSSRRVCVVTVALLGALFAGTLFAQGGWLDVRSEERYFIYAVPALWVFAVAAIQARAVTAPLIAGGGVVLAVVAATVPVTVSESGENLFLGPVSRILRHVTPQLQDGLGTLTGLENVASARDVTALVVLLVALASAIAWRRGSVRWALAPAVALQLALCGYAVVAIDRGLGEMASLTSGPAFAELGWVDRAAGTGAGVSLVQEDGGGERELVFWNDRVLDALRPEGVAVGDLLYPVNALPARSTAVGSDLALTTAPARPYTVGLRASRHLQLDGEVVAQSGEYVLRRVASPPRALWAVEGLATDGNVRGEVTLRAAAGQRVTLDLAPPNPGEATTLEVELGGRRETFASDATPKRSITFDLCGAPGPVTGRVRVLRTAFGKNDTSGGRIERVVTERC